MGASRGAELRGGGMHGDRERDDRERDDRQCDDRAGFFDAVYDMVDQIPRGRVATYGQIARLVGWPRRARFVGYALHGNPRPGVTPCHRVVFADGSLARGFAFGGEGAQRALLEAEGITFLPDGRVDLAACRWEAGLRPGEVGARRGDADADGRASL